MTLKIPTSYEEYLMLSEEDKHQLMNISTVQNKVEGVDFTSMIGKKVYKPSGKPFKSGKKVNTVFAVINHPILNVPAFTFEEDDSFVGCHQCLEYTGE